MMHSRIYLLLGLAAAGMLLYWTMVPSRPTETSPSTRAGCDINHGACTQPLARGSATLDIAPKPVRAMTDLVFTVTLKGVMADGGVEPDRLFIDLDMPDMFMGYNRVVMTRRQPGVYSGAGVIVRCPSGMPTWKAVVSVPGAGEATFVFDVIY